VLSLSGQWTGAVFAIAAPAGVAGYTFAGAWTGGFAAMVYGTDAGQGIVRGAVLGLVGGFMAQGGSYVPDYQVLDTATYGGKAVFLNQFVNDFLTGAAMGAAYAGVTGKDILTGIREVFNAPHLTSPQAPLVTWRSLWHPTSLMRFTKMLLSIVIVAPPNIDGALR
jgi:hypothetical protein